MSQSNQDFSADPTRWQSLCDRFVDAWRRGQRPSLETLLAQVPAGEQAGVLRDLLALEVTLRREAGEAPHLAEYHTRFPGLGMEVEQVFQRLPTTPGGSDNGGRPVADAREGSGGVEESRRGGIDRAPADSLATFEFDPEPVLPMREPAIELGTTPPESIGRFRVDRVLGSGGFGTVYLAHDLELDRPVAIKVPNARAREQLCVDWLREARLVAQLDHPHIVPVLEVGTTPGIPAYIVTKYIDGQTLAERLRQSPLPLWQVVDLIIHVAEALDYAHSSRSEVIHRDIKPANLLLDRQGRIYVADFGLAMRETDLEEGREVAGTPPYMSPEQIRGEGHRMDRRSDIFSLGVVLYELLTGRRPFRGPTRAELRQQISSEDPKPPRQINPGVSAELERICLKALSKLASDRYSVARDLAADLRQLQATEGGLEMSSPPLPTATPINGATGFAAGSTPPMGWTGDSPPTRVPIVSKGLRPFDREDQTFFLELLPGDRDRNGLPESLHFWKRRLEGDEEGQPLLVGLLTGPSGCGKSSLVRAGLIPRLADRILPLYVEATPHDTEEQLLAKLRRKLPQLERRPDLASALKAVRLGQAGLGARSLLLIIDQFEQWLHAHRGAENVLLAEALRHCDGEHLQCLLLVRDDYALSVYRFLRVLEIPLVQGVNHAVVDRFDLAHARKVLTAFGRSFGCLPAEPEELTAVQRQFVERAVDSVAEHRQVIPVRLALFAEMFRHRPWTPGELIDVGGAEGVGRVFLHETFSSDRAPPQYRVHARGARQVLAALLPEVGSEITGHRRSRTELIAAAGYGTRPREAGELLNILDGGLRLITPVERFAEEFADGPPSAETPREAAAADGGADGSTDFQLAHDYLVPSVRRWLEDLLQGTSDGRARLLLRERSRLWNDRPQNRHLPSWAEHWRIRRLIPRGEWTGSERKMLSRAALVHARDAAWLVMGCLFVLLATLWISTRVERRRLDERAEVLVAQLPSTDPRQWDGLLDLLGQPAVRDRVVRLLQEARDPTEPGQEVGTLTRLALLELRGETDQLPALREELLAGPLAAFRPLRDRLHDHADTLVPDLWTELRTESSAGDRRYRAAMALAGLAPIGVPAEATDGPASAGPWTDRDLAFVVGQLLASNPETQPEQRAALRPLADSLLPELERVCCDEAAEKGLRIAATSALIDYAAGDSERLARALTRALPEQHALLSPVFGRGVTASARSGLESLAARLPDEAMSPSERVSLGRQRANAAVTLLSLGARDSALRVCDMRDDPEALTQFLFRCRPRGVSVETLLECLDLVTAAAPGRFDPHVRYALLVTLAEYPPGDVPTARRETLLNQLADWYRHDPNSGVHGAAGWLLRQWGAGERVDAVDQTEIPYEPGREWFTEVIDVQPNRDDATVQGALGKFLGKRPAKRRLAFTFVVFPAGEYTLGSAGGEPDQSPADLRDEVPVRIHISRPFAMLDREVTFDEYAAFDPSVSRVMLKHGASLQTACWGLSWYESAIYCWWLGLQRGVPESEQCYASPDGPELSHLKREPVEQSAWAPQNWPLRLTGTGYRLATEAEWEAACRGLSWHRQSRTAYGFGGDPELLNRFAWSGENSHKQAHSPRGRIPGLRGLWDMHGNLSEWVHDWHQQSRSAEVVDPTGPDDVPDEGVFRVTRGGSWNSSTRYLRSAQRNATQPAEASVIHGFRLVRSLADP